MLELEHKPATVNDDAPDDRGDGSAIDQLRRLHRGLAKHRTRDFDVPGYNGRLVARYRRLSHEAYREAFAIDGGQVDRSCQFLIAALDGLHFRGDDGTLEQIANTAGTGAASWWDLGELLGLSADSARHMVVRVFDGNELAVNQHAVDIDLWMTSLRDAEDDEFAGGL